MQGLLGDIKILLSNLKYNATKNNHLNDFETQWKNCMYVNTEIKKMKKKTFLIADLYSNGRPVVALATSFAQVSLIMLTYKSIIFNY